MAQKKIFTHQILRFKFETESTHFFVKKKKKKKKTHKLHSNEIKNKYKKHLSPAIFLFHPVDSDRQGLFLD